MRPNGWRTYTIVAFPEDGVPIELTVGVNPVEIYLSDTTSNLPATAKRLTDVRPARALPAHLGDTWMVYRRLQL